MYPTGFHRGRRMVEEVDAEIGRVLQALEDAGQISGSGFFVIFETINRPEKKF